MRPLKMFAIDVLWRITCVGLSVAEWLAERAHAALGALEAAYVRLDELEEGE